MMNTLEKLRKQRAELDKKIEELEHDGDYSFKKGDDYWVLFSDGVIQALTWDSIKIDKDFDKQGNTFPTKEAAELEAERRNLLHRFKMFRDKCNDGWEPDWKDDGEGHFYIYYDYEFEEMKAYTDCGTEKSFHLFGYFEYEEYCNKAIELFGDEIKRLYVEV